MTHTDVRFDFRRVTLIAGGHFAHDVYSSFLAVFLPLLIAKFSLSLTLAGVFTVIFRLASFVSPLLGVVADRVNLMRVAVWSPAVTALCFSLLGVAPSYAAICLLLLAAGVSAAVFHVTGPVMIARVAGTHVGRGMSLWMTGGELARTLGPMFAVWGVALLGFENTYPLMLPGLLASVFLHLQISGGRRPLAAGPSAALSAAWREIRPVMVPLAGVMACASLMSTTLAIFLPTYLVSGGHSLWLGGAALALLEGAGTVGTLTGGTVSDRIGRRRLLGVVLPLSALLMLAFVHGPAWCGPPVLVLMGLSLFAVAPIELAIVQDHCRNCRGTANGLFMGVNFMVSAGVTVMVGWLGDQMGLRTAFTLVAMGGFVGAPMVLGLPRRLGAIVPPMGEPT